MKNLVLTAIAVFVVHYMGAGIAIFYTSTNQKGLRKRNAVNGWQTRP